MSEYTIPHDGYFTWLALNAAGDQSIGWMSILGELWRTTYIFNYDIDKDRNADGLSLRTQYTCITGDTDVPGDDVECTCLEALVAIAMRCDSISGDPGVENIPGWFQELFENLRSAYDGDYQQAIMKWMNREYAPDGRGGLFPLNNPVHDQRYVPTWNQMCSYLSEK